MLLDSVNVQRASLFLLLSANTNCVHFMWNPGTDTFIFRKVREVSGLAFGHLAATIKVSLGLGSLVVFSPQSLFYFPRSPLFLYFRYCVCTPRNG